MDQRWQYVVGDLAASVSAGALASWIAWLVVVPGWSMWLAMFGMMMLGMVLGTLLFFFASGLLGAHEAMIPMMFNGMIAGMVVGMSAAMMPIALRDALAMGVGSATGGLVFVWIVNAILRGPVRPDPRDREGA
ncbi:MAG: hypothetical protein KGM17_12095 [Sphingomonadales bacterium]|nr:hypothetical protein [Sphingomonadales bacterium]